MGAWECCEGAPWNPMVDDPFPYLCNCWEQIPFSDPRYQVYNCKVFSWGDMGSHDENMCGEQRVKSSSTSTV